MGIAGSIVVFIVIWWLVLFMVLPFGVRQPEQRDKYHAAGAPEKPMMWIKVGITTGITVVLFAIAWFIADAGLINFRQN